MLIFILPNARPVPLPDELICRILQLLTPLQVIHLRSVSKQFYRVIDDLHLWKTFYTNSCLPRPPGPFPWHSTKPLQRILIHSERVSHNWTTRAVDVVARTPGPHVAFQQDNPTLSSWNFLLGRLFVWFEGRQVLAQDLESGTPQVLWESYRTIVMLDAHSLDLPDAQRVYIAIRHRERQKRRISITLLEFSVQDTGPLLGSITWERKLPIEGQLPFSPKSNSPLLKFEVNDPATIGRRSRYLACLIVDVQSRRLYKFPAFHSSCRAMVAPQPAHTLLVGTHAINIHFRSHRDLSKILIQVFTAPNSSSSSSDGGGINELCLTHEVLHNGRIPLPHCLIRSVENPVNGSIELGYLGSTMGNERTKFSCITLATTPPTPSSKSLKVGKLSVDIQDLVTIETRERHVFLQASDNGHARGLITVYSLFDYSHYRPRSMYKFMIDVGEEGYKAVVSAKYDLDDDDDFRSANRCVFDGVTGRLCYDSEVGADEGGDCRDLVVLEIK